MADPDGMVGLLLAEFVGLTFVDSVVGWAFSVYLGPGAIGRAAAVVGMGPSARRCGPGRTLPRASARGRRP